MDEAEQHSLLKVTHNQNQLVTQDMLLVCVQLLWGAGAAVHCSKSSHSASSDRVPAVGHGEGGVCHPQAASPAPDD